MLYEIEDTKVIKVVSYYTEKLSTIYKNNSPL